MSANDLAAAATGVRLTGEMKPGFAEILTDEAIGFVATLERKFGARRKELLALREARQARIDAGELPDFLPETRGYPERRLEDRPAARGSEGSARRDHRPDRSQDGD